MFFYPLQVSFSISLDPRYPHIIPYYHLQLIPTQLRSYPAHPAVGTVPIPVALQIRRRSSSPHLPPPPRLPTATTSPKRCRLTSSSLHLACLHKSTLARLAQAAGGLFPICRPAGGEGRSNRSRPPSPHLPAASLALRPLASPPPPPPLSPQIFLHPVPPLHTRRAQDTAKTSSPAQMSSN
jgi:hypothetical protein